MRRSSGLWRDEMRGLDELVDREAAFLAELEDRQLLVGEILRTSGRTRDIRSPQSKKGSVDC